MKKSYAIVGLFGLMLNVSHSLLHATVTFGSRDSMIQLASGTRLNVSSENLSINGTLKREAGAELTGNTMTFNKGVLSSAGLEAVLDGSYDPTGADTVRLSGSGQFRAEPGTLVHSLAVEGVGNRVEGQPLFSEPIVLADSSTELAFAIQSKLNQNIEMNGGTVRLDDNLSLADDVIFDGDGTIELNNRQLRLGGMYTSPWTNNLSFNNATDVVLDGSVVLNGTWTFGVNSCLNGNGAVLDLSGGGQIIVASGATLNLVDIHITGLGKTAGKLVMNSASSTIKTSNATFKLNDNFTTSLGSLYVNGPTTIQLGTKNWTFNTNGNLTVDGTVLWLDYLGDPGHLGTIFAPNPIYENGVWYANNAANVAEGNLALLNNAAIKESVDMSIQGQTPSTAVLLGGNVVGTVPLDAPVAMGPHDVITLTGDTTINGQGSTIQFASDVAQVVVPPGVTATLENVTMTNIGQKTFDFKDGSIVKIGKNVVWELDQDIIISNNATIRVLDTIDGSNVFTVRGEIYRRKLILAPLIPGIPPLNILPRVVLALGHNTLQLENVEFSGLDHVSFVNDDVAAASIALSGSSSVDVDSNFVNTDLKFTVRAGVNSGGLGTAMNFFVEGLDNELILRRDGLVLGGNISFGDYPDNHLQARFNLTTPLDLEDPRRLTALGDPFVQDNFPFLYLTGDPGVFLFSEEGNAWLEFLNFNACVENRNSNAFTVDDNALLSYKRLQVLTNPIKQFSSSFRFEGTELIGQGIDSSFVRLPHGLRSKNVLITALHLKRQKAKDAYEHAQKQAMEREKIKPKPAAKPVKKKGKRRCDAEDIDVFVEDIDVFVDNKDFDDEVLRVVRKRRARALSLPASFDQEFNNQPIAFDTGTALSGNIKYDNSCVLTNVTSAPEVPFNIVISRGTSIELGGNFRLDETHKLNVMGESNVIKVTNNMTIGPDGLFLGEVTRISGLTFEFQSSGEDPNTVTFEDGVVLDLEKHSNITFTGPGRVVFGDVTINFKGKKTVTPITLNEAITSRAYMIVTNNAELRVADGKTLRCIGIGNLWVTNRGKIMPGTNASMLFGVDVAGEGLTASVFTNDFTIDVNVGGEIFLKSDTGTARFGVHFATSDISVESGGMIFIDHGGLFEINANGSTAIPSRLKNLALGHDGVLFIKDTGVFSLGENRNTTQGAPHAFIYDGLISSMEGGATPGLVRFVSTAAAKSFTGRMNVTEAARSRFDSRLALDVVRALVQQSTVLTQGTLFTGVDGVDRVRTKDGVIVSLASGDIIIAEAANGTITGDNTSTGVDFTISPNGTKTNL